MEFKFTLSKTLLTESEKEIIKDALGLNDADFDKKMMLLAKSAFLEYKKMLTEKGLPTRADEVMQERLYFLIVNYYGGLLPSESEVSSLFQLTQPQSKTLIKNVRSRYRTKIQSGIKNTLQNVVELADKYDDDSYRIVITSENILEELNLVISQKNPELKNITAVRGSAGEYSCKVDTYNLLKTELGIIDE